jgi:hypothetical protein
VRVVAAAQGDVEDLLERVAAGLAALQLDEVEDLLLAVEHQVVQAHEDGGPVRDGRLRPGALCSPGALEGQSHVLGRAAGHRSDGLAGEGGFDDEWLPLPGGDGPLGQGVEAGPVEALVGQAPE